MNIKDVVRDKIVRLYQEKDYPISAGVNICGIRTADNAANTFNDYIIAFDKDTFIVVEATTDPGLFYRNNPINDLGVAIVTEGYHKDIWVKGLHKGQYPALVQRGLIRVIRDHDYNNTLNCTIPYKAVLKNTVGVTYKTMYLAWNKDPSSLRKGLYVFEHEGSIWNIEVNDSLGINLHHANENIESQVIGKWSAGCQVVQNIEDWNKLKTFIYSYKPSSFSYSLFNEDDYARL